MRVVLFLILFVIASGVYIFTIGSEVVNSEEFEFSEDEEYIMEMSDEEGAHEFLVDMTYECDNPVEDVHIVLEEPSGDTQETSTRIGERKSRDCAAFTSMGVHFHDIEYQEGNFTFEINHIGDENQIDDVTISQRIPHKFVDMFRGLFD